MLRLQCEGRDRRRSACCSAASADIPLDPDFRRARVAFSFYANSMELGDGFCVDSSRDSGRSWRAERCWRAAEDFADGAWYDDAAADLDLGGDGAGDLRVRFRSRADSLDDDVLLDEVRVRLS